MVENYCTTLEMLRPAELDKSGSPNTSSVEKKDKSYEEIPEVNKKASTPQMNRSFLNRND